MHVQHSFLMPFYLIQGRGLSSAQSGLVLTAQPIIMAVIAPIFGALSDRIGSRLPAASGMAVMAVGMFLLSRLTPESAWTNVMGSLAVVGLGTGMFISPNNSALMGSAPRNRQGIAAGVMAIARNVGMVLGIGISGAILTTILGKMGEVGVFEAVWVGLMVGAGAAFVASLISAVRGNGDR